MKSRASFPLKSRRALAVTMAALVVASPAAAQTREPPSSALTLRALLDSVSTHHPLVSAANSRIRAAEGSRVTARAFGNPTLEYQVENTPFPGSRPGVALDREAMAMIMLPLEGLYQRGPRGARGDADVRAARADAAWTRQRVGLDAAAAYHRAAFAQVKASTTHDQASWLDTVVAYQRSRVKEGVAAEADLIRSELERDRVAADATMDDVELAQARAALGAFLAGSTATPMLALDNAPLPFPSELASVNSPLLPLLQNRSDLGAARERVSAAQAAVRGERSMLFRELGATLGTKRMMGTTSMIAGLSFPIPVFNPNRGEIQRAAAERDAATFDLAAQERSATADLAGAYESARLLTDRATALASGSSSGFLARADEARRIALGAYREGAVPLLQVIDAARAWGDANVTYYRLLFAQRQSVLTLVVAGGFDLFTFTSGLAK